MKKLLLMLSLMGLGVAGFTAVHAQYYGNSYYYDTTTSYASSYSHYSYPASHYYDSSYYYGGSYGIGSYTIGCTTYYYNTRTGASLGTYNVCTYTQPYYNYNHTYTYPIQQQTTQYCTYMYRNGGWYPSCNDNNYYGGGGYNYINCHYNPYGQYVCW